MLNEINATVADITAILALNASAFFDS